MSLPAVIKVDKDKCRHCLACIQVCPVKLCNIVEPDGISVKSELCIGCGECIRICHEKGHGARSGVDDFAEFLEDLRTGVPLGILLAPSAAVNFDPWLPQLLTALHTLGVERVFDVSFGAEITTHLYVKALQSGVRTPLIAQPCPAVVSFIEIYQPQLLPYLAPTHSPALDAAVWLKSLPEIQHLKLAFLGPCLAKRREVHDPNTKEVVSYSITFESLARHLDELGINLPDLPPGQFDTPEAERAVVYSRPGGLTETFLRFGLPVNRPDLPRVEGAHEVYAECLPQLVQDIQTGETPILLDVLNCRLGCNDGPTVSSRKSHYQIERIMEKRRNEQIEKHKHFAESSLLSAEAERTYEHGKLPSQPQRSVLPQDVLRKFFAELDAQSLDFSRTYSDRSSRMHLREPDQAEEEQIWLSLHKLTPPEREVNCSSCGYGSCRNMMLAIANGLNHVESCKYYLFKENELNLEQVQKQAEELQTQRDQIAAWNEELETMVQQRTQELTRTNEHLKEEILEREAAEESLRQAKEGLEHLNSELQVAYLQLQELDQMKTDFLSTVSHELRTPLTSILGFARIIQRRMEEVILPKVELTDRKTERAVTQVRQNLSIIVAEGERLTSMINDVLDIAKMEAGRIEWKMETTDLADVIERSAAAISSLFEQKGLALIKRVGPNLPPVLCDRDRIIQVILNLLSNALKFTANGSVTCQAGLHGNFIMVSIRDEGIGIAPEDQPKVFEKFKQIGDTLTDKPQGTGLGLPICKQIIEHHNGRIWVESTPGRGSTFSFTLPVAATESSETAKVIDVETLLKELAEQGAPPESGNKNILVVDDDANIRSFLHQVLEEAGYGVREAANGIEAVQGVKKEIPDLILLDVMMPGMNGFDVAAVLKNDPETMHVPVVILSIVEDRERGYKIGVDRYFTKPVDLEQLLGEIELLVDRKSSHHKVLMVNPDLLK